jgi:hypothetical protein
MGRGGSRFGELIFAKALESARVKLSVITIFFDSERTQGSHSLVPLWPQRSDCFCFSLDAHRYKGSNLGHSYVASAASGVSRNRKVLGGLARPSPAAVAHTPTYRANLRDILFPTAA